MTANYEKQREKDNSTGEGLEENDVHIAMMSDIKSNAMSCLDCHGPVHPEQVASKKTEGGGK